MKPGGGPWVKVCGVTCPEDALASVRAGADAIGLNFVPSSRRYVDRRTARAIADAVRGQLELVGVFANEDEEALESARREVGLDWLQLHGAEPAELVHRLPRAFKALGIADASDVQRAAEYPGERLLLDAKVDGALGGTGLTFDWSLLRARPLTARAIVAGGLNPENVAALVELLSPFGVDVASGVEQRGDARRKDPDKLMQFVRSARRQP